MKKLLALLVLPTALSAPAGAGEPVRVEVAEPKLARRVDLGRLLGGNVALWYRPEELEDPALAAALEGWRPTLLRLPGGSWSDEIYWNGHGVREGDAFDRSKRDGSVWQVDFSDYAPGFRLAKADGTLSDFHGNVDVRALHEFVKSQEAAAVVTVNAGTGTPKLAAEWVRWAKKEGYRVDYWEVGNELDGEWELGHTGPDGKVVDADEYARRFKAFATAMKAVDPTAKVGGPTCSNDQLHFVETLIREAGDLLDFVSFHTYPVLGARKSEDERFEHAGDVARAVERIRNWIAKYQPDRQDAIEIGVSEWHKQVMETRPTVDLSSGIWSCLFIGEMAASGVDFANQWDFYSAVDGGGHGLFGRRDGVPRAMFRAMELWRGHMGSEWLAVEGGSEELRAFATREGGVTSVMLVNTSRRMQPVELVVEGRKVAGEVGGYLLSQGEYFWNPIAGEVAWSTPARAQVATLRDGLVTVPPFSVLVLKPGAALPEPVDRGGAPVLELLLPDEAPTDLPVEGFVLVRRPDGSGAWQGALPEVRLEVDGPATAERTVDTSSSVGRFTLRATGAGATTVEAVAGNGMVARGAIRWTAVEEREEVLWTFGDQGSLEGLESNYGLALDTQARPNQAVAVARLDAAVEAPQANTLLAVRTLPESLERGRIGGVTGLLGASSDLDCDDPRAAIQVVLQSNHDHWIPVGRVPLSELRGGWEKLDLRFNDPDMLEAMPELYSLRFQLVAKAPVTGRLYFDDLGFILRGKP